MEHSSIVSAIASDCVFRLFNLHLSVVLVQVFTDNQDRVAQEDLTIQLLAVIGGAVNQ